MRLFLCCPFCRSPTQFTRVDNATYVVNGEPVCHRPLCREKAVDWAEVQLTPEEQSLAKAAELGIGAPYATFHHDVGPP